MNLAQHSLLAGLWVYRRLLSPLKSAVFGPFGRCRFTPSCSAYAVEAVRLHGAAHGTCLAVKRLLRCHPWGGCGDDPVPPARQSPTIATSRSQGPPTANDRRGRARSHPHCLLPSVTRSSPT